MMPVIRISDATFADLKSISTWLGTQTPGDTIDQIVRRAMEQLGMERDSEPGPDTTTTSTGTLEFEKTPGLAFTKPQSASVNGKTIHNPRWSGVLSAVIDEVKSKGMEGEKLVRELHIQAKAERYVQEGFKYHPDLGISVQGQSAADAWKEAERLAKKWRIPVIVEFSWRQNPKAQYPGRAGVLRAGNA